MYFGYIILLVILFLALRPVKENMVHFQRAYYSPRAGPMPLAFLQDETTKYQGGMLGKETDQELNDINMMIPSRESLFHKDGLPALYTDPLTITSESPKDVSSFLAGDYTVAPDKEGEWIKVRKTGKKPKPRSIGKNVCAPGYHFDGQIFTAVAFPVDLTNLEDVSVKTVPIL